MRLLGLLVLSSGLLSTAALAQSITVYEFYHAGLNHYFRTADVEEVFGIADNAAGPGWVRTGDDFAAYPLTALPAGAVPVCRFYGSMNPGPNSHFYTANKIECDDLKVIQANTPVTQKRWNYEGLAFGIYPSTGGSCASGLKPVYRSYNDGAMRGIDSNHRYTTSELAYRTLGIKGWKSEGIMMCASTDPIKEPEVSPPPQSSPPHSSSCVPKAALQANGARYQLRSRGTVDGGEYTEDVNYLVTTGVNFQSRSLTELKAEFTSTHAVYGKISSVMRGYYELTATHETHYGVLGETVAGGATVNTSFIYTPPTTFPKAQNIAEVASQTYRVNATQSGNIEIPLPPNDTQFTDTQIFRGFERVSVPAGNFKACKFEYTSSGGGVTKASTVWTYAGIPAAGIELKVISSTIGRGGGLNVELVSATLPGGGGLPPN